MAGASSRLSALGDLGSPGSLTGGLLWAGSLQKPPPKNSLSSLKHSGRSGQALWDTRTAQDSASLGPCSVPALPRDPAHRH